MSSIGGGPQVADSYTPDLAPMLVNPATPLLSWSWMRVGREPGDGVV